MKKLKVLTRRDEEHIGFYLASVLDKDDQLWIVYVMLSGRVNRAVAEEVLIRKGGQ